MPRRLVLLLLAAFACSTHGEPVAPAAPVNAKLDLYPGPHGFGLSLGSVVNIPIGLFDDAGNPLDRPPGLTLVSRNPAVISVDSGRWIHARAMDGAWLVAAVPFQGKTLFDSNKVGVSCTMELIVSFTPNTVTLDVGETSVVPVVFLGGCSGQLTYTDTFTWSSNDPTIATVDATSGRATGVRAGVTFIRPTGARFGSVGVVAVTVR